MKWEQGMGFWKHLKMNKKRSDDAFPSRSRQIESALTNLAILLLSSAFLCAISLNFAIGTNDWSIYLGYFRHPVIFILNWIPVFLLQWLIFAIINRHDLSFFLNALFAMLPAIGNFYKLKLRNDPFSYADVSSIRAGLAVAADYDLQLNTRIIVSTTVVLLITLILCFLVRCRAGKGFRIASILVIAVLIWPLWHMLYANEALYGELAQKNYVPTTLDSRQSYIDTGFPYPFLHSIKTGSGTEPVGYDEGEAASLLEQHQDADIEKERRVNLLVIQMESFCDLEAMGINGISPEVYAPLRSLQKESLSGTMIANVIGGGTINTERCVLAGTTRMMEYNKPTWSYVRYMKAQGYQCIGSHPNVSSFYSRYVVMEHLGFDSFLFSDYFNPITGGEWRCDSTYIPEVFRVFSEAMEESQVFSFNITLQGHGPYNDDAFETSDRFWKGSGVSKSTEYALNNYLSYIAETQRVLADELEKLRSNTEPVVVLLYGDHKPWLEDKVYAELGITFDISTENGLEDYAGTPYIIWANDAAKNMYSKSFVGKLPVISPGYMLNVLFDKLDWRGPAYMQCTEQFREHLPVIYSNGYYVEDGEYTAILSKNGEQVLRNYEALQYYVHTGKVE